MSSIEQRLEPIWRQWNGILPLWAVKRAGIRADSFRRWAADNPDVDHVRRGVYAWYPENLPDPPDPDWRTRRATIALAAGGPEAVLYADSVLELLNLGTVGGSPVSIAVPTRRRPAKDIRWIHRTIRNPETIHGLRIQPIREALIVTRNELDTDKYEEAVIDARDRNLITGGQAARLLNHEERKPVA